MDKPLPLGWISLKHGGEEITLNASAVFYFKHHDEVLGKPSKTTTDIVFRDGSSITVDCSSGEIAKALNDAYQNKDVQRIQSMMSQFTEQSLAGQQESLALMQGALKPSAEQSEAYEWLDDYADRLGVDPHELSTGAQQWIKKQVRLKVPNPIWDEKFWKYITTVLHNDVPTNLQVNFLAAE